MGSRSWLRICNRSLCVPFDDSEWDAARSALPRAAWKPWPGSGVVIGVVFAEAGCGDWTKERGGDVAPLAPNETERRPSVRGDESEQTELSFDKSRGGRSGRLVNAGDGVGHRLASTVWLVQSSWSRPRPTSMLLFVVGDGIQGGVGTGGSDIFGVFPLDRPLRDPIERRALSFLVEPPLDFSDGGLWGC